MSDLKHCYLCHEYKPAVEMECRTYAGGSVKWRCLCHAAYKPRQRLTTAAVSQVRPALLGTFRVVARRAWHDAPMLERLERS